MRPLGGQFIDLQDRGIRTNFWGIGADGGPTGDWTHWDNGGLVEATALLEGIEGVHISRFNDRDVVRHALVGRIVRAYDAASAKPIP